MALSFLASGTAWASSYESFPEFESLSEAEQERFEGPGRLSPEYSGDLLAYRRPGAWQHAWLRQNFAFDLDVGSLNASQFMIDNRFKVRASISELFQFRITWFEQRNLETDSSHLVPEVVFKASPFWGFSLYGEVDLYKRQNDTGLALLFWPAASHELRVFNTFVDVTREKRSDRTDRFAADSLPRARGIVGRWVSEDSAGEGSYLEYAARYETPTRWLFPDQSYEYTYWRGLGSLGGRLRIGPAQWLEVQTQVDRRIETREGSQSGHWRRDRLLTRVATTIDSFNTGLDWSARHWHTDEGLAVYRDLIAFGTLTLPALGEDRWSAGLQFGCHRSSGPSSLFVADEKSASGEHKLILSYDIHFVRNTGVIRLIAAGDLDEMGTRRAWDGGDAQVLLNLPL